MSKNRKKANHQMRITLADRKVALARHGYTVCNRTAKHSNYLCVKKGKHKVWLHYHAIDVLFIM